MEVDESEKVEESSPKTNNVKTNKKKKITKSTMIPTMKQISSDSITKLCEQHWKNKDKTKFDKELIIQIYNEELKQGVIQRAVLLEISHYLENYLWPHYN